MMIFMVLVLANLLWKLGVLATATILYLNTNSPWYLFLILLIVIPVVDAKEFIQKKGGAHDQKD